jgi:folate-binding protein YgfZ
MITDLRALEVGDALLLDLPFQTTADVVARLGRFVFSEDVAVRDVTGEIAQLGVYGPASPDVVARALAGADGAPSADTLGRFTAHQNVRCTLDRAVVVVAQHAEQTGEIGFDLFVPRDRTPVMFEALRGAGAREIGASTLDVLRIEAGLPVFGRDMDEETIPLEAGLEARAISFTKGCYVGQEVIVRVRDRGHGRVARRLVGLVLPADAAVPPAGAAIRAGDRDVGRVTSAARSPALGRPIALGYVHRDFVEAGTVLSVAPDAAPATVTRLPFVGS